MASVVYILGTLTTMLCSVLLLRGYTRSRQRLLLWSGLCFAVLTLSNALLFLDLVVLLKVNLLLLRLATAALAMALLLYGLVWESER
jgi:hypothetical protein